MVTNFTALLSVVAMAVTHGFTSPLAFQQQQHQQHGRSALRMATADAAAKVSYEKVFVAGGSRGVGRCCITALRKAYPDTAVVALVRSQAAFDELSGVDGVSCVLGDALDYKTVEGAMDGCDAVVTTLGRNANDDPASEKRVDYTGNSNVIEAAGILGVTRVVLVTSLGCGDSRDAIPASAYEVLRASLESKSKAESMLVKYYTNTNWTIVRPGGLKSEPRTGTAVLTTDRTVAGAVHREDVADLVVSTLTSPNTMRQILAAVDLDLLSAELQETLEVFAL